MSLCGAVIVLFAWYSMTALGPDSVDMRGHSPVNIVLADGGYRPKSVTVTAGTTLIFSTTRKTPFWPASNPHPSHSLYPEFDSMDPIDASSTWTFVITKSGVWGYHDHIRSYFTGVVYVK